MIYFLALFAEKKRTNSPQSGGLTGINTNGGSRHDPNQEYALHTSSGDSGETRDTDHVLQTILSAPTEEERQAVFARFPQSANPNGNANGNTNIFFLFGPDCQLNSAR